MTDYSDRLRKADWTVRPVSLALAEDFIARHHYAGGASNTAVYQHGLFRRDRLSECSGIAWWLPPTRAAAEKTYPEDWQGVLSLSRLAIAPGVPKNACTFLLSRSIRLMDRDRWPCLVTYADEWQGHAGTIYRAAGWAYEGLTKPERIYTRDGVMVARKAGPKSRTHDEMIEIGCECVGRFARHKFTLKKSDRPVSVRRQMEMLL